MRKIFFTSVILFISGTILKAQTADEKEVAAAVEQLRQAMIDGNKTTLENLSAEELSYGHSGGQIEDKSAFVEKIASGKSDFTRISLEEQTIKIVGDVAVVRHKLIGETIADGKPGPVNLNVLLIWQKQKGKWKLLARQSAKIL